MSLTLFQDEVLELRAERRDVGGRLKTRYYKVPMGADLEGSNLAESQPLPDDPIAIIVTSDIVPAPSTIRKTYGGQVAHVVAWRAKTYTGRDNLNGFVELSRTRGVVQIGPESYQARRVWKGPNSTARIFANAKWDERYPEISGKFSPRARRTEVERDWRPGFSRVTAFYKTIRDVG
ncbi:hypothetical protein LCGC14_2986300, partial [marine sediment metagenome]